MVNQDAEFTSNIHHLQNAQQEIHSQPPENLDVPISKQKKNGIHQVQTSLTGAIISPYRRNNNIPHSAIKILTNETNQNKVHKRSWRIIEKNLKPSNNTITTGPHSGPQDIFAEHYDCEIDEISIVFYHELNKVSTCTFKPMDLEKEKTGVQLLSRAKAIEIKVFAVKGTLKEAVQWFSQHTEYIRTNSQGYYYYSDAQ